MATCFHECQVNRVYLVGVLGRPVVKNRQPGYRIGGIDDVPGGSGGDANVRPLDAGYGDQGAKALDKPVPVLYIVGLMEPEKNVVDKLVREFHYPN